MIVIFSAFGCEDVVEVDLPETETRLVVNAIFRVNVDEPFIPVSVRVTETSSFFDEPQVTQLDNAIIFYGFPNPNAPEILENGGSSSLAEIAPGTGIYEPDPSFDADQRISTQFARPDVSFIMILEHEGHRYAARTSFAVAVPIDNLAQGDDTLFGEDDTEILVTITDIPNDDNFYVFEFGFNEFLALDDQFIDGQQFEFSYFFDENLVSNDLARVNILGADQQFFNYINLLVEQTQNDGGIFETPAVTARGNVFDVTGIDNDEIFDIVERPENFPLGYFAVVQEFKDSITIE